MSNSTFQSLLMESGGSLEPDVPTCVADPYYSCGPTNDPYWASVVLMLHMDGVNGSTTFTDSSTASESMVAVSGAALSTAEKKFGTASLALNGTSDYIEADAVNTNYDFGSNDFTVEAWVYSTESGRRQAIITNKPSGSPRGFEIYKDTSNRLAYVSYNGVGGAASSTSGSLTIPLNQWVHIAVARQNRGASNFQRLFINGQTSGWISGVVSIGSSTGKLTIGTDPSTTGREFAGYIDEVRITRNVGRYWGAYTIPTEAFPNALDSDFDPEAPRTVLSLHCEDLTDSSCYNAKTITAGGTAAVSATQAKFGSFSFEVINTGTSNANRIIVSKHQDLIMFAGDWTLEMWVYRLANTYQGRLFSGLDTSSMIASVGTDGLLDVTYATSGGTQVRTDLGTVPTGQWCFLVFQRRSNFFETYIDGVRVDNVAVTSAGTMDYVDFAFYIGGTASNISTNWNGYFDEIRLTKGVARYTADFDVATLPNCDSTSAGGILPTSGTEYPRGEAATVQTGQITLANHYQPLSGQSVSASQGYTRIGAAPITPTLVYTTSSNPSNAVITPLNVQLRGRLFFDTLGNIFFSANYSYSNGEGNSTGTTISKWLDPNNASNGQYYEIQIDPSYRINYPPPSTPPGIGIDYSATGITHFTVNGDGGNNIWNSMEVERMLPLYRNFEKSSSSQLDFVDLAFSVRPRTGSGLVGPVYEKTYTIRINFAASKFK